MPVFIGTRYTTIYNNQILYAPFGFVFLLGADGAQLLGADGAPLYGVA